MSPAETQDCPLGRPTLGFVTSNIHDPVHERGWLGVADAACERDANLVCFVGGLLGVPGPDSQANVLYALADAAHLDGVVVHSNSLNPHYDPQIIQSVAQRFASLCVISSAGAFGSAPYVGLGQQQGTCDIVSHLIEVHDLRRLAYLTGPEAHPGAESRFAGYRQALAAHGIPFDPALVTPPSDRWINAPADVAPMLRLLLDERGLRLGHDIQAFVADSDAIALPLINFLRARGARVPEDVAVVGYNDYDACSTFIPSLTTVRPPFHAKGQWAVAMALACRRGDSVPDHIVLPCEVKVRQSCGCVDPLVSEAGGRSAPADPGAAVADLLAPLPDAAEAARRLEEARRVALADGRPDVFLREVEHVLLRLVEAEHDATVMHRVLSTLRGASLGRLASGDAASSDNTTPRLSDYPMIEAMFQQARVIIGETARRAQVLRVLRDQQHQDTLRAISQRLVATFDVARLMDTLAAELPRLGITSCYLALYAEPQRYTYPSPAPAEARLVLALREGERLALPSGGRPFASRDLIPDGLWPRDRFSLVAVPLYFQDESLGFALFGIGPREAAVYETLRGHISSALKGALLFEEAERARARAEQADRLKTRLLANVSHELRAPSNVILGYTRAAQAASDTTPPELLADLRHIHTAAEHQLRLINDLLDLSRAEIDELDLSLVLADPRPLIEDAFASIAGVMRPDLTWRLDLPERLPVMRVDPVRLRQILLNLLSNAAKFVNTGEVCLGAEIAPPHLHLWVRDTGAGIAPALQDRIFEPFVTAEQPGRRVEGVGLGLTITRRLVALHDGQLSLDSRPGEGTTFHIYLPLPTLADHPRPADAAPASIVLVISACAPPLEIDALCRQRGWVARRLDPSDDLAAALANGPPAAVAWDLTDPRPADWLLLRRLRRHPQLVDAPFILYGMQPGATATLDVGVTSFVGKSDQPSALVSLIESLAPAAPCGPILIADDDPAFAELCRGVAARAAPGRPIHLASSGQAAIQAMRETPPALVILDLVMPDGDGFAVLDWMRGQPATRQTPVLVLSNRLLTLADVKRLETHAHVTLQSKGLLSDEETMATLQRILSGEPPRAPSPVVKQAIAYLHQNYARVESRVALADAVGVSEDHLARLFDRELGMTPWEYLKRFRVLRAKDRLRHSTDSVEAIAHQVGFHDPAYFSRVFRKVTGQSPRTYRDAPTSE